MKGFTKKTFVGIEVVLYIACHSGAKPVRSREICKHLNVKLRYLEQIMQTLVHEGILRGVRGPKGGYLLAKERRRIKLSEVFDAVQKMEEQMASEDKEPDTRMHKKIIEPLWHDSLASIRTMLSNMTIQDLCDQAAEQGAVKEVVKTPQKADFVI